MKQPVPEGEVLVLDRLSGAPVTLPSVQRSASLPYSQWELDAARQLLAANGVPQEPAGWRAATRFGVWVVESAAYQHLARHRDGADRALFVSGLSHDSPGARAWAAFGLARLGSAAGREALEALAAQPDGVRADVSLLATGLLGELGVAEAFVSLWKALRRDEMRRGAAARALPFVRLQGAPIGPSDSVDVWAFYRFAVEHGDDATREVVLAQLIELEELDSEPVLRALMAAGPKPSLREGARRLLVRLRSDAP